MGADVVIVASPAGSATSCFVELGERFAVEKAISHSSMEGFDKGVFPRTAWHDVNGGNVGHDKPAT